MSVNRNKHRAAIAAARGVEVTAEVNSATIPPWPHLLRIEEPEVYRLAEAHGIDPHRPRMAVLSDLNDRRKAQAKGNRG